jgi:hypothetical protein
MLVKVGVTLMGLNILTLADRLSAVDNLGAKETAECREHLAQLRLQLQHTVVANQDLQALCEQVTSIHCHRSYFT